MSIQVEPQFVELTPYKLKDDASIVAENFYQKMRQRRSIRKFSTEKVDTQILVNAIKAAGTAPNGANLQPWFFAIVENAEVKKAIRTAAESVETKFYSERASEEFLQDLKPFGTNSTKEFLTKASTLIVVFTRSRGKSNQHQCRSYYPLESTGIAVGILLTALHQSGLSTLTHTPKPMGFLNEVLGLDETYRPFMIVAVGHPEAPVMVPNISKKSIDEICQIYK